MTHTAGTDARSPLTAATALTGLRARTPQPPATGVPPRGARRHGPMVPLLLAGTMAIATNITGAVPPVDATPKTKEPRPKPAVGERGHTVREAIAEARRAAAAAAAALRATLAAPPTLYTVQQTDTLPDIAARYGLSTASLLALNGLSWSSPVFAGQVIKLTQSGPIAPASAAATTTPEPVVHVVQSGESLAAIADRYGVRLDWLLASNGIGRDAIIYPGQQITIPEGAPPAELAESTPAAVDSADPEPTTTTTDGAVVGLTDEMRGNASIIISVGRSMGVPDYGIVIALATAAQESTLRNLDWGDRDSVGLFQQRPSQGWGTVEQLTDPYEATRRFFGGPGVPTYGLLDLDGWQSMALTVAAQAVQISAYPDAYAKWEASAWAWLAELG